MKTLFLECNMGAAGDMLMGALYELIDGKEEFLQTINTIGLPGIRITPEDSEKCGIHGTHMKVEVFGQEEADALHSDSHTHHHHGCGYQHILHLIDHLKLPDCVKADAGNVYRLIGEAEAFVHHSDLEHIHFHEVGTLDAVADVVGCCLLIYLLAPEQIVCSPINVGSGFVTCAHGTLPVPAPAAAKILTDVPCYSGEVASELCTPTGAALLKYFVSRYEPHPVMSAGRLGYGMGQKNFPTANCLRAYLGESFQTLLPESASEEVTEIVCNLDDMTGEALGFATEILMESGALDVYTTAIYMKKNRPGILLTCLCKSEELEKFSSLIFRHTSTRGMRYRKMNRFLLDSSTDIQSTPYGDVRVKTSSGNGISKSKPEFDDLKAIALKNNITLQDIYNRLSQII